MWQIANYRNSACKNHFSSTAITETDLSTLSVRFWRLVYGESGRFRFINMFLTDMDGNGGIESGATSIRRTLSLKKVRDRVQKYLIPGTAFNGSEILVNCPVFWAANMRIMISLNVYKWLHKMLCILGFAFIRWFSSVAINPKFCRRKLGFSWKKLGRS